MLFRSIFISLFFFSLLGASAAHADGSDSSYDLWQSLKTDGDYLLDHESQNTALAGVVAEFASHLEDVQAREYFNDKHRLGNLDDLGNKILGTGVPGALLGAGFWIYGDVAKHGYETQSGQAQLEALAMTGIATELMKETFRRERPDGSNNYSFPSGHTSTIMASAAVLGYAYGWQVGVPMYALGVLTGLSRISVDKHWFSDTVGGAALGIWIGRAVARAHLSSFTVEHETQKTAWSDVSVFPAVGPDDWQMIVRKEF